MSIINTIMNVTWLNIAIQIVIIAIGISIISWTFGTAKRLFKNIINNLNAKTEKIKAETRNINSETFTNFEGFYSMIETMVTNEVVNLLHKYADTDRQYPYTVLDNDVEIISKTIYSGFDTVRFNNLNVPIKSEYMMTLLVRMTTRILSKASIAMNTDMQARKGLML